MKTYTWIVLQILLLLSGTAIVQAQNVTSFRAVSSEYFTHTTLAGVSLPNTVLHWQLESMGGERPLYNNRDILPGFQWFTPSFQAWYFPDKGNFNEGNIIFTFKIPSDAYVSNAYVGGNYSLAVTQNYTEDFTPVTFNVIISVPNAISWLTANNTSFTQITSLDSYRSAPSQVESSLGDFVIGNTLNYKLYAKSVSSTIQFTSTTGVQGTRNIAMLSLGSTNPKITTLPLSSSWKDYTAGNSLNVASGNRTNFPLKITMSQADFKTYFYEAGTYRFDLNLDAKSTDNSTSSTYNIAYGLRVSPLSEITMPTSGQNINFEFNTVAKYRDGETKTIPNQLKISNNETYELYVKTDASFFRKAGVQSDVPSSILQVGIEGGSPDVALSTTSQKIINSGIPVLDKNLTMRYAISANAAQTLLAKEKSTYSINVIYSFTAL